MLRYYFNRQCTRACHTSPTVFFHLFVIIQNEAVVAAVLFIVYIVNAIVLTLDHGLFVCLFVYLLFGVFLSLISLNFTRYCSARQRLIIAKSITNEYEIENLKVKFFFHVLVIREEYISAVCVLPSMLFTWQCWFILRK